MEIAANPSSLSGRILKARYFPQEDLLNSQLGSCPSQIWRGIQKGIGVLKQGLIRRIGTGQTTNAWNDNWLPREGTMRPITTPGDDAPALVGEFIDQSTLSWNVDKLNAFFLPIDVVTIRNIPLSTRRQEDFWAWQMDRRGLFIVRSAYKMLVDTRDRREAWLEGSGSHSDRESQQKQWKSPWKTQVP